ncbi:MAG: DNA-protecting protein DprA [candidate division Zixibacteria bacterium]|nr:DNA-protecting protein DprA [candidate division Zixibacteria bacterium]
MNAEVKKRLTEAITLLSVPGIGRGRFLTLVRKFGSVPAVLSASVSQLESISGISKGLASNIRECQDQAAARKMVAEIAKREWQVLFWDSPEYPKALGNISDAPPILFFNGQLIATDERMIAIVGTRHATEKGKMFAYNLASELARSGVTVVSGMAEGIDSAAHRGALDAGGRTVAVWGTSLEIIFPPLNRQLAGKIAQQGTILSEYLPGTRPDKATFPDRNRIISGLSAGVVVVEAGEKSGALITADCALDQNRSLFAVPGSPGSKTSLGCNRLIKKGARLLTGVEDIFEELPYLKGQVAAREFVRRPDMTKTEIELVSLLSEKPLQIDQLSRAANMSVAEVMEFLLALELKGIVQELSGKRFTLAEQRS